MTTTAAKATRAQPRTNTGPCPSCYGTGKNKRGGPCKQCHATGQLSGAARTGAAISQLGKGLMALAFFGMLLAFCIALLVGIIIAVV